MGAQREGGVDRRCGMGRADGGGVCPAGARSCAVAWAYFLKLAVVTFGGAYAVLAYMAQQAVGAQHWLSAAEMADGLGLAETTPGR
jgi:hypothetical protein